MELQPAAHRRLCVLWVAMEPAMQFVFSVEMDTTNQLLDQHYAPHAGSAWALIVSRVPENFCVLATQATPAQAALAAVASPENTNPQPARPRA